MASRLKGGTGSRAEKVFDICRNGKTVEREDRKWGPKIA